MTRIRFGAVFFLLLATAASAIAQPGRPPGGIPFKQFGATPEQFFQSSVTRWTGQLALDLEAIKDTNNNAAAPVPVRGAIGGLADNAIRETAELDQLVRRGAPKDKLRAAFADVDKSFAQLTAAINQQPAVRQATAAAVARADGAFHQLGLALGGGDNDPARLKRRMIRTGDAIDDAADELRNLCEDQVPNFDRGFARAIGQYGREARLLSRRVRDDVDPDFVKRTYTGMGERWADLLTRFARGRGLPPAVTAQVVKVDGLHRRLGAVMGLPPFPAGTSPQLPELKRFSFAVGANAGANPHVIVFSDEKGTVAYSFFAYEKGFDGGVRVDMADLNGDGIPELVVAPGPSKGNAVLPVKVFDGRDLHLLVEFVPFPGWKGGLHAAGADLSKDGRALIAVNADGGPNVKIFDLAQGKEIADFTAHDPKMVAGGVRLAWGDVNGDGVPDILAVNGPSNTHTRVKVFSGKDAQLLANFPVLDEKYKGGGFVAAVDFANNGQALPVVGFDAGALPLVRVFDLKGKPLVEWLAYDDKFRGGVRVAVSSRNHIVTAPGPVMKNSPVRIFDVTRPKVPVGEVVPFPGFDGGLNVGGR
ncbi:MAG: hypothetical protein J0I06_07390 [Planctomycetes bacterium]|nr:hypothetical protein [Planctomycetota bacterium]